MANFERGVYEPGNEVRVFDGAEEDDDVEGSRLPLLIVLALLVLAMFGGVVWLAYTQGVAKGRGETPVLTAASGPERIAPAQPGGTNVPYQNFKVYEQPAPSDDAADSGAPAKPAPEKQVAAPTQPAVETPMPKSFAATPTPAPPKTEVKAPAPPPPKAVVKAEVKAATPAPAKPVVAAAKPVTAPAKPASAPAKSVASLIQQADAPAAKSPPPALKQTVATPAPADGPASGAPRQLGAPVAATPAPKAAPAAKASGSYILQIGAYKSQADADTAWKAYKAKHAALLSGYSSDIQQANLGDKGTWYRLRIAGFSDREVASGLCDRLKADGGGCFLGK